jgi:integrase
MATVYKRREWRPIPDGAEIITYRGKPYAAWTDGKGKARRAPLNAAGNRISVLAECYTAQYFDENGKRRKAPTGCHDKAEALRYATRLENEARKRRTGEIDAKAERYGAEARRPLGEHLADFRQYLTDKQNSAKHIELVCTRVGKLVADCKAETIADLTDAAVMAAIGAMRNGGAGLQTLNHYIRGIKQFSRWLKLQKRAIDDALAALAGFNAETDRRYVRRELQPDELVYLLRTVESYTTPMHNLPGPDRAMAYRVALGTGFRAKELRSLTPASFDLDSNPPTVTVQAGYSKRRRLDVQPIRQDLAALLRPWLAKYGREEHPFAKMPERTARMLQDDLDEARRRWLQDAKTEAERATREQSDFLKHTDADGRVLDFHGTRHTYISGIVAGGASVKVAQELARHSTPTLTIGRYAHARLHDLTAALDALPGSGTPQEPNAAPEAMAATGTDGLIENESCGQMRGQYTGKTCLEGANCGERPEDCSAAESGGEHGQEARHNVLSFPDLAASGPQAAERGKTKKSGWGGIRTPGGLSPTAVFKTAALDHSATHPVRDSVLFCLVGVACLVFRARH